MKRGVRVVVALAFALSLFITGCDTTTSAGQNIWDFIKQTIGKFLQELFSGSINDTMLSFVVGALFLILIWALFHEIIKKFGFFGGAGKVNNAGMALTFAASTMSTLSMVLYAQSKGTSLRESVLNLVSPFGTFGALGIAFLFGIMTFYSFRDTEILEDGIGKWFIVGGSAISVGVGFFYVITGKPPVLGFWITFLALLLAFIFFLSYVLKGIGGGREPEFEDFGTGGLVPPAPAPAQPPPGQPPPPPGNGGGPGPQPPGPQPGGPTVHGLPPEILEAILRNLHQQRQGAARYAQGIQTSVAQEEQADEQLQDDLRRGGTIDPDDILVGIRTSQSAARNTRIMAEEAIPIIIGVEHTADLVSPAAPREADRVRRESQEFGEELQELIERRRNREASLDQAERVLVQDPQRASEELPRLAVDDLGPSTDLISSFPGFDESLETLEDRIIELRKSLEELREEHRRSIDEFRENLSLTQEFGRRSLDDLDNALLHIRKAVSESEEGRIFDANEVEKSLNLCRRELARCGRWTNSAVQQSKTLNINVGILVYAPIHSLKEDVQRELQEIGGIIELLEGNLSKGTIRRIRKYIERSEERISQRHDELKRFLDELHDEEITIEDGDFEVVSEEAGVPLPTGLDLSLPSRDNLTPPNLAEAQERMRLINVQNAQEGAELARGYYNEAFALNRPFTEDSITRLDAAIEKAELAGSNVNVSTEAIRENLINCRSDLIFCSSWIKSALNDGDSGLQGSQRESFRSLVGGVRSFPFHDLIFSEDTWSINGLLMNIAESQLIGVLDGISSILRRLQSIKEGLELLIPILKRRQAVKEEKKELDSPEAAEQKNEQAILRYEGVRKENFTEESITPFGQALVDMREAETSLWKNQLIVAQNHLINSRDKLIFFGRFVESVRSIGSFDLKKDAIREFKGFWGLMFSDPIREIIASSFEEGTVGRHPSISSILLDLANNRTQNLIAQVIQVIEWMEKVGKGLELVRSYLISQGRKFEGVDSPEQELERTRIAMQRYDSQQKREFDQDSVIQFARADTHMRAAKIKAQANNYGAMQTELHSCRETLIICGSWIRRAVMKGIVVLEQREMKEFSSELGPISRDPIKELISNDQGPESINSILIMISRHKDDEVIEKITFLLQKMERMYSQFTNLHNKLFVEN